MEVPGVHSSIPLSEAEKAREILSRFYEQRQENNETGQTTKQPVIWCCLNQDCNENGKRFIFESEYDVCPKCGFTHPIVYKRSLIHVLVKDKDGPIRGDMGFRYRMLCSPKRTYLSTGKNGEAATVKVDLANCPGCLAEFGNGIRETGSGVSYYLNK